MKMDVLFSSFFLVLVAEIGDKTQLLSILLIARFRAFWPVFWGVLLATLLNHYVAAQLGEYLSNSTVIANLSFYISIVFIVLGLWVLIPDKSPDEAAGGSKLFSNNPNLNAFISSLIAFFIAEIGDKTQLVTFTLGAEQKAAVIVTIGTTLGMLAANVPALLFGEALLKKIPMKYVRYFACALFLVYGLYGIFIKFN